MSGWSRHDLSSLFTPNFRRGIIYVLVALNIVAFGILTLRILMSLYGNPDTSILLLQGLRDQRGRLDIISRGPCDSSAMQQYRRGEIGPLVRDDTELGSVTSSPATEGQSNGNDQPSVAPQRPDRDVTPQQPDADPAGRPPTSGNDVRAEPELPSVSGAALLAPASLRSLVNHSVVRVVTAEGFGSGFAIGPNTIITNRHVVENAPSGKLFVTSKFLGSEPVEAKLITTSQSSDFGNSDFAVLQVQSAKALTPLNIGGDPKPLDSVVAAGYPGASIQSDSNGVVPEVVFSQGEVSVVQPQSNGIDLVIHTADFAPGSSGGPLISRCGTVMGVNTFLFKGDDANGRVLYSLSGKTLSEFLKGASIPFRQPASAECGSEGN